MASTVTNKTLILLSQLDGRDKIYKTCQYGARLVWWILHSKHADPKLLHMFSGLDSSFSDARRVFRLGGFVKWAKDLLREPFLAGDRNPLLSFRFLCTLSNFIAECLDVVIYATKIKVISVDKKRWDWWRNLLWMITILYAITDQIVAMKQILAHRKRLLQQKTLLEYSEVSSSEKYTEKYNLSATALREKKVQLNSEVAEVHEKITNVVYNYIRFACDMHMCASLLQNKEHKGVFGLLGVISGVIGLKQSWKKL